MRCQGLITGVVHKHGTKNGTDKKFDFYLVNFIDSENPSGSPMSMSLPNEEIGSLLPQFESNRMKVLQFNVYQNGDYTNFGGFVK